MKLEIYNESKSKPKQVLRLRLMPSDYADGGVVLAAVDAAGARISCGRLLEITRDGYLKRWRGINDDLGLVLNGAGYIVEAVE